MTHFAEATPVARIAHECNDCGRTIRPGERYHRGAGMDGFTAWTWKECAHCVAIAPLVCEPYEDTYRMASFEEWEPTSIAHLRLKANWGRRWERRDGSLVPIPVQTYREDATGWPRLVSVEMP